MLHFTVMCHFHPWLRFLFFRVQRTMCGHSWTTPSTVRSTGCLKVCGLLAGFTGARCEVDIDECASRPCLNGATCRQSTPGTFRCECPTGFTDTLCQTDIDECATRPCANGGSCLNGAVPGTFTCNCRTGFTGPTCGGALDLCK
jgi:hypothetical protein